MEIHCFSSNRKWSITVCHTFLFLHPHTRTQYSLYDALWSPQFHQSIEIVGNLWLLHNRNCSFDGGHRRFWRRRRKNVLVKGNVGILWAGCLMEINKGNIIPSYSAWTVFELDTLEWKRQKYSFHRNYSPEHKQSMGRKKTCDSVELRRGNIE